jgi:hypothetical protein
VGSLNTYFIFSFNIPLHIRELFYVNLSENTEMTGKYNDEILPLKHFFPLV